MSSQFFVNLFRFTLFLLLQVLVFRNLEILLFDRYALQVLIFPLFILLLPYDTSPYAVLAWAFAMGVAVDAFYASPGIHTSAVLLTGFLRNLYFGGQQAGRAGTQAVREALEGRRLIVRLSIPLGIHIAWYNFVEIFSLSLAGKILLDALIGWVATMFFVSLYVAIFNPKV